jgi:hypothetical protein
VATLDQGGHERRLKPRRSSGATGGASSGEAQAEPFSRSVVAV